MILEALSEKHFKSFDVQIAQRKNYTRLTEEKRQILIENGKSFAASYKGKTYCIGGWIASDLVEGFDFMVWTYLADNVSHNMTGVLRVIADALAYLSKNNYRAFALTPKDFLNGRRMLRILGFDYKSIINIDDCQPVAVYVRP